MALATAADVATALRRALTVEETAGVAGLLDEASDLVDSYLGWEDEPPTPIPGKVVRVTARTVARLFEQEAAGTAHVIGVNQTSRTMGPFTEQATYTVGANTGSPWLSTTDKATLKRLRRGSGMTAVPMSSPQTGAYRTEAY